MAGIRHPYSATFISVRLTTASAFVDYTVPSQTVALLSSTSFVQDVSTAVTTLAASVDPTGAGTFTLFFTANFAAGGPINSRLSSYWQGHIAVPAGGKIRAQALGGTNGYAVLSGYLLTN